MEVAANFCLLHAKLSKLGFDGWASVNEGDVMTGNPHTFAVLLRYLYRRFPTATASLLRSYDWFLLEADDVALGATTLRLLRTASAEAGLISATQFGQSKYAMAKINMCHALLRLLRSMTRPQHSSVAARTTAIAAAGEPDAVAASPVRAVDVQLRIAERRRALNAVPRS